MIEAWYVSSMCYGGGGWLSQAGSDMRDDATRATAFMGSENEPNDKLKKKEKLRIVSCIGLGCWCSLAGSDWTGEKKGRPDQVMRGSPLPRRYQIKERGRKHRDCGGLSARLIFAALWRRAYCSKCK